MRPQKVRLCCLSCLMLALTLAGCSTVRDTVNTVFIAPVAAFAWTMDQVAPLPPGPPSSPPAVSTPSPGSPSSSPTSTSIYNDRGARLGYAVTRPDGSVDVYRADSSRLGYSAGSRTVISPRR